MDKSDKTPEFREDFIKRLFAVTLSVGVATQLSQILFPPGAHHVLNFTTLGENWRAISLLLSSVTIVVSSWEGYLGAIGRLPLHDAGRFFVDIALVFTYLVLALCSQTPGAWFTIHAIIFFEYLLWDILRSRLPAYKQQLEKSPKSVHERSMTITIVWLLYFVAIAALNTFTQAFDANINFALLVFFATLGVFLYRRDKKKGWSWTYKILFTSLPLSLLIVAALFL